MTKIDIISGFLGAGKTTLIKKLVAEALKGQKVVLIENEFGEIGIDGGFMKDSGIQVNEMNSGCICCSLVGDFKTALHDVLDQYQPDRIIIEPSGVGKLSDVIKAVQKVVDDENVVLDSYIAVCDAKRAKMYLKNFGEFYKNQVEYASAIILSRTQDTKPEKLEKTLELIRGLNDKSPVVTTPWDELDGKQLLEVIEGKNDFEEELLKAAAEAPESEHHHHHDHDHDHEHHHDHEHEHHDHDHEEHDHHHDHDHEEHDHHHDHDHEEHDHDHEHHHHHHGHDADEIFTSWGQESPKKFTEDEIKSILEKLAVEEDNPYGIILRAKGIVPAEDGRWIHFDLVPGEEDVRYGSAEYTGRICVIGSELKEDKLKELFAL
ncbi:MAG: CobW family GTP-binding protein [Lachnospiraceae bacterium]|nr:CobW family GTP-binding protein [Lachnospiraceae bacterium]